MHLIEYLRFHLFWKLSKFLKLLIHHLRLNILIKLLLFLYCYVSFLVHGVFFHPTLCYFLLLSFASWCLVSSFSACRLCKEISCFKYIVRLIIDIRNKLILWSNQEMESDRHIIFLCQVSSVKTGIFVRNIWYFSQNPGFESELHINLQS